MEKQAVHDDRQQHKPEYDTNTETEPAQFGLSQLTTGNGNYDVAHDRDKPAGIGMR